MPVTITIKALRELPEGKFVRLQTNSSGKQDIVWMYKDPHTGSTRISIFDAKTGEYRGEG